MGLFKFAKDAGEKMGDGPGDGWLANIFKGKTDAKHKVDVSKVTAQRTGDRVVLQGKAKTQAEAEKIIIAAGNNKGVAEVESHIEVEQKAPPSKFHEVKSGDTLSKIAKTYYGDAMKYPVIFEANKPLLTDPDKIYPGQMLRIPELPKVA